MNLLFGDSREERFRTANEFAKKIFTEFLNLLQADFPDVTEDTLKAVGPSYDHLSNASAVFASGIRNAIQRRISEQTRSLTDEVSNQRANIKELESKIKELNTRNKETLEHERGLKNQINEMEETMDQLNKTIEKQNRILYMQQEKLNSFMGNVSDKDE